MTATKCSRCGAVMQLDPDEYGADWVCISGHRVAAMPEEAAAEMARRKTGARAPMRLPVNEKHPATLPPEIKPKEKDVTGANVKELTPETSDVMSPPAPPRPENCRTVALCHYYESNRQAIQKDIDLLGQERAMQRWGMSARSLGTFIRRSKIDRKKPQGRKVPPPDPPVAAQGAARTQENRQPATGNNGLPAFPEFSECQTEAERIKWLEIYPVLAGAGK